MRPIPQFLICAALLSLAACSRQADTPAPSPPASEHKAQAGEEHAAEPGEEGADVIHLSGNQVAAARIQVAPVRRASAGAIEAPATIVAHPRHSAVIAVAVGGRITELRHNLGEPVGKGDVLAVIESADAAQLKAEVEAARSELALARITLQREERLHREKVSAEQDYLAARNAAQAARIRTRLAEQRLSAAGGSDGGPLNRLAVRSPMTGHVIARTASLGDVVAPNAELFRVAKLSEVALELSLSPDDISRVDVGNVVEVSTNGRAGSGRVTMVSRVLDPATRQVRILAALPNSKGEWRIGETVRASIVPGGAAVGVKLAVPQSAVQTVEDKPSVFVRTKEGFAVRHLVVGPASAGYVAVVSGLEGNEQVATTNSYVLKAELGKAEGGEHAH